MNVTNIYKDFPILSVKVQGHRLIYFDNAATTQKPRVVIDAISHFYLNDNASVYRGVHTLSERATVRYEKARVRIAQFISAKSEKEIVFVRGATHGINIVAQSYAKNIINPGDEILISALEHHSNIIIWQQIAELNSAVLKVIPIDRNGLLQYEKLSDLISKKTKIVAVSCESNAIGSIVDVEKIITAAKSVGAKVFLDASQMAPHQKINVQKLGCDFLVFSGHKMCAPTGIGVLYVNEKLHEEIVPNEVGGGMLTAATFESMIPLPMPRCLEAGTPSVAAAVGLHAAIDYIEPLLAQNSLRKHEAFLVGHLIEGLQKIAHIQILGPMQQLKESGHMVSFVSKKYHAHDIATYLDHAGIAVRAGDLCAQPLAKILGVTAMIRVSFYCYNTIEDVQYLLSQLNAL